MLNITTCTKIRDSELIKTWSAEWIVRMQIENQFEIVPQDLFINALTHVFDLKVPPTNLAELLGPYKEKFPVPLTLRKMLEAMPKSFYMQRVK
jgi:hypothetical protein